MLPRGSTSRTHPYRRKVPVIDIISVVGTCIYDLSYILGVSRLADFDQIIDRIWLITIILVLSQRDYPATFRLLWRLESRTLRSSSSNTFSIVYSSTGSPLLAFIVKNKRLRLCLEFSTVMHKYDYVIILTYNLSASYALTIKGMAIW